MQRMKHILGLASTGICLLLAAGLWLMTSPPAHAQCGSQASSCKNCHEVQGKMPVNNDGTAWHTEHAFGDFCYICHAGNNQATGEAEAHTGMVPPLSDIKASCQQCHPNDLQEVARIYATALGVEIGAGASASPVESSTELGAQTSQAESINMPAATQLDIDDPNLVDFVQRYNEIVLGKRPLNIGNAILVVLIGLVGIGGGGFALYNEVKKDDSVSFFMKMKGKFPEDVLALLPGIANLTPDERESLKSVLDDSRKTETLFEFIAAQSPGEGRGNSGNEENR